MRRLLTIGLFAALLTLGLGQNALAWNGEAHQLVAWIAEARLSDKAKAGVKDLLGDAYMTDAEVAGWADQIRRERKETAPWHYVNIPVDTGGYDATRDGNGGNNVIDAIERFSKVLADKHAPKADRVEALKFVIHFVGDLHQPLHCAERNGDKGGNKRLVFFLDQRKAMNLHSVWDTIILKQSKGTRTVEDYGDELNKRIDAKHAKAWAKGTPLDWALESWKVAREHVYTVDVPADGDPPKLGEDYVAKAQPVVDEQIQKAGVRLATALNRSLR